jgi:ABC-type polysaccharide/polyol phosphate transport system ATPase subunit/ABC-type polysaccharide/polyol phosphate export permease
MPPPVRDATLPSDATDELRVAGPAGSAVSVRGLVKRFRMPGAPYTTLREHVVHLRRNPVETLTAVDDVSFEVERGSCVGIVGRNGSGKSTLLRCIADIYPPDAGEVAVSGRLAALIELGIGFDRELNARENLITTGMLYGLSARDIRGRFDEIVAYAGLERFAQVKLKNYSSGMATRLGFALTTHIDADVLLFDEAIATGDVGFQEKCLERFAELRAEGRTLVLVTHDMTLVENMCDRALLLDHGSVLLDGSAAEVAARYDELNLGGDLASAQRRSARRQQRSLDVASHTPAPGAVAAPPAHPVASSRWARVRRTARISLRFAAVEYRLKYADTVLGYAWAVLRPLATFAAMYVVFTRVAHFNNGVSHYAVYLLSTIVLWTFFLDATNTAVFSLVRQAELLRKLPMPRIAIPLSVVLRALLDLGMNLVAVAVFLAIAGIPARVTWLELPLLIFALALIATAIALLTSAVYVRLRDIDKLWSMLAQILFYASPILYVATSIPRDLRGYVMALNPLAAIFTQMRHALLDPTAPSAVSAAGGWPRLLVAFAVVAVLLGAGVLAFQRIAPQAAEEL